MQQAVSRRGQGRRNMVLEDGRTKVSGGCACGDVRFGFYEPVAFRTICHCRACQYASGGGPAYLVGVPRDQFRVTRGHPGEFATLSEAGNLVTRVFCATCGSPLYSYSEGMPDAYAVKVGALDDPSSFRTRTHIWTSEAQPWHPKGLWSVKFRRNPPFAGRAARGPRTADYV